MQLVEAYTGVEVRNTSAQADLSQGSLRDRFI